MSATKKWLKASRARVLEDADSMAHALMCPNCGLRWEALIVLAVVGWNPDDFYAAAEKVALGTEWDG
jgi:hypothetical protein